MMKKTIERIDAIDILRGLIMVLMALDHTRHFLTNAHFNPLDIDKTTPALFLTRWITHYCAPLFVLLSGISTWLSLQRGGNPALQSRLLLQRGVLLIFLELLWVGPLGWDFGVVRHEIGVGVLWAIGWSMLVLALLVRLPLWVAGVFGLLTVSLHNLTDGISADTLGVFSGVWKILHQGGAVELPLGWTLNAYYPLIPWVGVMALGFAMAPWLNQPHQQRQAFLMRTGLALTLGFVLLRLGNLYGDSRTWAAGVDDIHTLMSFVHCTKYPPSLHYLLMTLGPGLMLLSLLEKLNTRSWNGLRVFGQVPLFFYLIHLPLLHALAALTDYGRYGQAAWQFGWPWVSATVVAPEDHGFGLLIVYLFCLFVLTLLYPLCKRYQRYKVSHSGWLVRLI